MVMAQGANSADSASVSPAELQAAMKTMLEEHPELILEVLEKHEIAIADLVERGMSERARVAEQQRILAELENPFKPVLDDSRPMRGPLQAPVTIVEYSDFECPYCGAAYFTLKDILRNYEESVRFVYKHNPLSMHPMAEPAARYFEAIALQDHDQAWKFHDELFIQQHLLEKGEEGIKTIVASLAIDQQRLDKDLNSELVDRRIAQDRDEAEAFGFDGTPAFLINGVSLLGNHPEKDFIDIIHMVYTENRSAEIFSQGIK
jgi:protein-disulfide isomerase